MGIVGLELKLSPWQLDNLFLDNIDKFGLLWWAELIQKQNEKVKTPDKK